MENGSSAGSCSGFHLRCTHCGWTYVMNLSSPWKQRTKMIPIKFMVSFMLSGLTYENYKKVFEITDVSYLCKGKYYDFI